MTETSTTAPASITIPEGATTRVSGWIASADYRAAIVPGTYAIEYAGYDALVRVRIESPERVEPSTALAGRTITTRTIEASTDDHTLRLRAEGLRGAASFGFHEWALNY